MFVKPAEVLVECAISVVYSDTTFCGVVTAQKATFVAKLQEGRYQQLNVLQEQPDDAADDFSRTFKLRTTRMWIRK
jgi:hypothetical protein